MRARILLSFFLAGACHQQQTTVAPTPASSDSSHTISTAAVGIFIGRPRHDIEHFIAAFPAADSGGVCGSLPPEAIRPGESVVILSFPAGSEAARRVTARYDASGALTYYQDHRGDLRPGRMVRGSDGSMHIEMPSGRRTEIDINLVTRVGLARNTGGDGPEEAFASDPSQMLDAASLDYPRKMAAFVHDRCRS